MISLKSGNIRTQLTHSEELATHNAGQCKNKAAYFVRMV